MQYADTRREPMVSRNKTMSSQIYAFKDHDEKKSRLKLPPTPSPGVVVLTFFFTKF
jgi:hypothetical protein